MLSWVIFILRAWKKYRENQVRLSIFYLDLTTSMLEVAVILYRRKGTPTWINLTFQQIRIKQCKVMEQKARTTTNLRLTNYFCIPTTCRVRNCYSDKLAGLQISKINPGILCIFFLVSFSWYCQLINAQVISKLIAYNITTQKKSKDTSATSPHSSIPDWFWTHSYSTVQLTEVTKQNTKTN